MTRYVKVPHGGATPPRRVLSCRTVPSHLRELRAQKQAEADDPNEWSQAKVAGMVRVAEDTYRAWESERRTPQLPYRIRLAQVFGVTVEELGFG